MTINSCRLLRLSPVVYSDQTLPSIMPADSCKMPSDGEKYREPTTLTGKKIGLA